MTTRLRPLPLQELRLLPEGRTWQVDQPIAGITSLTPVRGQVRALHLGTMLEVDGTAGTIVTLCCDRCLQTFNHALEASARELLEIGPAGREEEEVVFAAEDPVERLDPSGCFDPERWLFEQLSLRLPLVNRCGGDCPGPPQPQADASDESSGDPRWAVLRSLR
ncbi:MAG: metal-binding protein [Cyanobium sp. CACIAM 14]|nr:MAG: metal-binding protein [Cyanobium sp. CACIAM 14]